ncbi:MAG: hypothetical protein J6T89_01965 [Bacteroidales bacterium]|nr:hypothetical protein [Bacteroidales bacterium]
MKRHSSYILAAIVLVLLAAACASQRKLSSIRGNSVGAGLRLSREESSLPELSNQTERRRDTLKVQDLDGKEVLIMRAIKDESTGEMVATEVLDAAVVTARFRNVAERRGEVDIEFQVIVSDSLQDRKWQLRFYPRMYVLADTLELDPILITGDEFRRNQVRGYQRYENFLASIAKDSSRFIDTRSLEIFLERNLPQLYRFKEDTSVVTEAQFASAFGVTEQEALQHYTNKMRKRWNAMKVKSKDRMFRRYVKTPIQEGIRLDTVIAGANGDFIYNYLQTIHTRPKLRKVDVVLQGEIRDGLNTKLYDIPPSPPLTFYISSVSAFVDDTERYKLKIIERRAEANTAYRVAFATGKSAIDVKLGDNQNEMQRIRENLRSLMQNEVFDLDSIVVTASCSPEGSYQANEKLAQARSESVTEHFRRYIRHYRDSIERERGFMVDEEGNIVHAEKVPDIPFTARSNAEDWEGLYSLVQADTLLSEKLKEQLEKNSFRKTPPDEREGKLRKQEGYAYIKESLYPLLRTVKFDFFLHRKGMVKDTIHTTVLDTTYMDGVQAIRDHDYELAISLLRPYNDFNTAVAYLSMDYNASARAILEKMERSPMVNYMLAILYSRDGDDQNAVQCYYTACQQDQSYVFRGNLDPEISALIKRYNLNAEPEDDLDSYY